MSEVIAQEWYIVKDENVRSVEFIATLDGMAQMVSEGLNFPTGKIKETCFLVFMSNMDKTWKTYIHQEPIAYLDRKLRFCKDLKGNKVTLGSPKFPINHR